MLSSVSNGKAATSLAWMALLLCATLLAPPRASAVEIDFSREIRPLLSDNCFFCHGPDENKREADLRLDTHEGALTVLKPGKSIDSDLMKRLTTDDPEQQMPPPKSHRTLSKAQIARIARWIDEGAKWGDHWAYRALQKPLVPKLSGAAERPVRNPIDAFVQARLAQEKLTPALGAPRATLIRRLSLDLTGLPPTPEEVAAFLADKRPDAYEQLVDRLLASPAFGERLAWDWLDAARYADSNGYQGDLERTMWPWRDWVVRAINGNLPFDQFTVWQLAGDMLPHPTTDQRLATGFCRNHMINGEGGRIPEENRIDYVMDMTDTMSTVWLGLTSNCCHCHDHKYDPVTRRDYYRLFAYFNQTPVTGGGGSPQTPPVLDFPSDEQKNELAGLDRSLADLKRRLKERSAELAKAPGTWEERLAAAPATDWKPVVATSAKALHQSLTSESDGTILASGENPPNDTYTITAPIDVPRLRAVRLEALRHPSMTGGGLARSDSGNFVLTEFEISLARAGETRAKRVPINAAVASFEQGSLTVKGTFDANSATGWAVWEGRTVDREHEAVFYPADPPAAGPGSMLTITLRHDSRHKHHNLGRFRLSVTSDSEAHLSRAAPAALAALNKEPAKRTADERNLVAQALRQTDKPYRMLADEIERSENKRTAVNKAIVKVMVMEDLPKPRLSFMLERGLYNKPGDEVTPGVPVSFAPLPESAEPNRLSLARWLVSTEQPLTPRVTVNRFWQQFFGLGLVKTTEDFGVQGELPPYLELLDWLAADFRDSGWDVKRLVRQIVTSHTYRQSSKVTLALAERDPENRLLARGARFRLPAWMLRDQALAASGLLVSTVGGAPVNTYQPAGVWEEATFGNKIYKQDHGDALYRRSLYTFWRRIVGPTMFFDNATRQTCTVKVLRTNTPLHALLTLNDTIYVEAARVLAQRVLTEPAKSAASADPASAAADDARRLDAVFVRVLSRPATEQERAILLAGLKRSRSEYRAHPLDATKLLAVGEAKRDEQLDPAEHAAWTSLCLAIWNIDEALTKE